MTPRVQTLGATGPGENAGGAGRSLPPLRVTLTRVLASAAATILVVALLATGIALFALNGNHTQQPIVRKTATASIAPQSAAHTVYFTGGATVYALHARDGSVQWKRTFANASYLLGVDGAMLYAGAASDNGDGAIFGLDKTTGAIKWQLSGYVPGGSGAGLFVVANGIVYMGVGTRFGTGDTLYAVNGQTGAVVWKQPFPTQNIPTNPYGPSIAAFSVLGGHLYVVLNSSQPDVGAYVGDLDVYDAATGVSQWKYEVHGDQFNLPLLMAGRVVYVAGYSSLYAFDAQKGTVQWHTRYPFYPAVSLATLLPDGQSLIVVSSYGVIRFDGASGVLQWSQPLDILAQQTVILNDGLIVVSTPAVRGSSDLLALHDANGQRAWSFPYNGKLQLMGASDNTLFVIGGPSPTAPSPAALYALNFQTGRKLWQHNIAHSALQFSVVLPFGSSVFCSTFSDQVLVFSAATGATEWSFTTSGSNINNLLVA